MFLRDRVAETTELVGGGNDESASPSISADGRYVAFLSYALDLVPGDVAGTWDVVTVTIRTAGGGVAGTFIAIVR